MKKFFSFVLLGLVTMNISLVVTETDLFNEYEYSSLYDALIVGILSVVCAFFILRGIYNKSE